VSEISVSLIYHRTLDVDLDII